MTSRNYAHHKFNYWGVLNPCQVASNHFNLVPDTTSLMMGDSFRADVRVVVTIREPKTDILYRTLGTKY